MPSKYSQVQGWVGSLKSRDWPHGAERTQSGAERTQSVAEHSFCPAKINSRSSNLPTHLGVYPCLQSDDNLPCLLQPQILSKRMGWTNTSSTQHQFRQHNTKPLLVILISITDFVQFPLEASFLPQDTSR